MRLITRAYGSAVCVCPRAIVEPKIRGKKWKRRRLSAPKLWCRPRTKRSGRLVFTTAAPYTPPSDVINKHSLDPQRSCNYELHPAIIPDRRRTGLGRAACQASGQGRDGALASLAIFAFPPWSHPRASFTDGSKSKLAVIVRACVCARWEEKCARRGGGGGGARLL